MNLEQQTFNIFEDFVNIRNGSLYTEFEPPLSQPETIIDESVKKPADWGEEKYIPDVTVYCLCGLFLMCILLLNVRLFLMCINVTVYS